MADDETLGFQKDCFYNIGMLREKLIIWDSNKPNNPLKF